jgi:hypothetical protein
MRLLSISTILLPKKILMLLISGVLLFSNATYALALENTDEGFDATIPTSIGVLEVKSESTDFSANQQIEFKVQTDFSGGLTGLRERLSNFFNNLPIIGSNQEHKVKVTILDSSGTTMSEQEISYENAPNTISMSTENLTPGTYTLKVTDLSTNTSSEQDFAWGVLAINPNKSIYKPGEAAKLSLAVLDDKGKMVCNANLNLQITLDENVLEELSTANGQLKVNEDACQSKDYTLTPDYEAEFATTSAGTYETTLTAETSNGTHMIKDSFEVKQTTEFDIERVTATRIYPLVQYPVVITIKANQDFKGIVNETMSAEVRPYYTNTEELKDKFSLDFDLDKGLVKTLPGFREDNKKTIKWQVDWKKDQTYHLAYKMGFPNKSPEFYLLGPLKMTQNDSTVFEEPRKWQLAIDATTPKTWTFTGSAEGLSDQGTSGFLDFAHNGTDNAVAFTGGKKSTTQTENAYNSSTGETWIDWGVPSDATVNSVQITAWEEKTADAVDVTTNVIAMRIINSSGTTVHPSGDLLYITVGTGIDSSYNSGSPGTARAIDPSYQDPSTDVRLELEHSVTEGSNNSATVDQRYDNIELTITYTPASDSWTGIAYLDEGATAATTAEICARVNNTTEACDTTDGSGEFVINSINADASDQLTFFFNDTSLGNTVTVSDGGDIASADNLKVFTNSVMVRHEQGSSIAISNMANYDRDDNSTDILYTANSTLSIESGNKFYVYSDGTNNFTFDPGNTVTTQGTIGDLIVGTSGTAYLDTATNSISGDLVASGSATLHIDANTYVSGGDITTTGTSATVTYSGTPTVNITGGTGSIGGGTTPSITFYKLTKSGGGLLTITKSTAINNDFSLTGSTNSTFSAATIIGGNVSVDSNCTLTINLSSSITGSLTTTTNGIVTTSSGTPTVVVYGTTIGGGSGDITFYNLTKSGAGTTAFSGSGTNTINHDLTVNAGTLTLSSPLTINNTGTVSSGTTLNINANLNVNGSTLLTVGTAVINTTSGTPTLTFSSSSALGGGTGDITLYNLATTGSGITTFSGSGTNTVNNNVTVGSGTTLRINTSVSIHGSLTNTTDGIITYSAGTPTVTMTSNSFSSIGGGSGDITFYNFATSGAGTDSFSGSGTNTIDGSVTVGSTSILNLNSPVSIAGNMTITTTGKIDYSSGTPTVTLTGNSNSINGGSGTITFYDLTIDPSSAGDITLNSAIDIENDFQISAGTLDANGKAMSIQGSWNNSGGTFTANSNTVTFTDTDGGETLSGTMTGTSSFYDIVFDDNSNSGAWSFGNNSATVTHDFTITGGSVTAPASGYTLTIGEDFTNNDSFNANSGNVVFNGSNPSYLLYSGTTTFYDLTISTSGKQMYFEDTDSLVTDIDGSLTIQGTNCTTGRVFLDSNLDNDDWEIDITDAGGGNVDIDYADIEDSTANNTQINASNSTEDNGGNTNWSITEGACGGALEPHEVNTRGGVNVKGNTRIK